MATLTRFRHGKNHTRKELAAGPLGTGAGSTDDSPTWQTFSLRIGGDEAFSLAFNRSEAAYIIDQLTNYLKRDTRVINGHTPCVN